jgi:hypothetical protein
MPHLTAKQTSVTFRGVKFKCRNFDIYLHWFVRCNTDISITDLSPQSYGLNNRGSRLRFPAGAGIFLLTTASRPALGPTQPPIQWVPGALSLGVKRPGREADHSPPYSAEVKECVELYLHSPIRLADKAQAVRPRMRSRY